MPKVTQYLTAIGTALGELSALYQVYEQLAPATRTFIDNEITAVEAEFATVKGSLDNFASASIVGKISTGLSLLNVFGGVVTFIEKTYANGEEMFASDWPVVKTHFDNILAIFKNIGSPATAAPTTTVAASEPVAATDPAT